MSIQEEFEPTRRLLFEPGQERLYAVLDGASVPNLRAKLAQHGLLNVCLLRGDLDPELAESAPYLAYLPPQTPFIDLMLGQGRGHHWGILAVAEGDFRVMRSHFRDVFRAWDPDGVPLFFRYYDPRVLRVYLPTCTADELRNFFGPVRAYFAEADTAGALVRFTFAGAALAQRRLTLTDSESDALQV